MSIEPFNPEIDTSTPEKEIEALLMRAYCLHVGQGGRRKAFMAKALDMVLFIEQELSICTDDRPLEDG